VDTEIFHPSDVEPEYDRAFVGNSRGMERKCVSWCAKHKIPLRVWGNDWKQQFEDDDNVITSGSVENDKVADIYRNSRVVLNDHWDDMRESGFVNNRIIEALCCGSIVITDYSESYEKLFGDCLLYYRDEEDFQLKIREAEENYEKQRQRILQMWPKLQEKYSFTACAKVLSDELIHGSGK
jgi:spore maturation protein CgeB